jgi:hypothetical protein
MKHVETLYINCEDNGHMPRLNNSHVQRLDQYNYHAYSIFVSHISNIFFNAQNLQSEGILNEPYCASIVIPKVESFKGQFEDNLTRIKYIANNFVPPKNGVIISLYEHWQDNKVLTPYNTSIVWPYKKQWDKENAKDYVCLQTVTEKNIEHKGSYAKNAEAVEEYKRIVNELNTLGIEYKNVSYDMRIDSVFKLLLSSRALISYSGATYYLAGGLNVPTIAFGNEHSNFMEHTITDNYTKVKLQGSKELVDVLKTGWGKEWSHQGKIIHYNKEKGITNEPQRNTINIGSLITDRDYEILRTSLIR